MTFDKMIYNEYNQFIAGVCELYYLSNSDPPSPGDNEGIDYYLISIIISTT